MHDFRPLALVPGEILPTHSAVWMGGVDLGYGFVAPSSAARNIASSHHLCSD